MQSETPAATNVLPCMSHFFRPMDTIWPVLGPFDQSWVHNFLRQSQRWHLSWRTRTNSSALSSPQAISTADVWLKPRPINKFLPVHVPLPSIWTPFDQSWAHNVSGQSCCWNLSRKPCAKSSALTSSSSHDFFPRFHAKRNPCSNKRFAVHVPFFSLWKPFDRSWDRLTSLASTIFQDNRYDDICPEKPVPTAPHWTPPSHFHSLCLVENPSNQQFFTRACPIAQHLTTAWPILGTQCFGTIALLQFVPKNWCQQLCTNPVPWLFPPFHAKRNPL